MKRAIVAVKAVMHSLAYMVMIATARVDNHPYYEAYRKSRKLLKPVHDL
jgi:hypothetical protein